MNESSKLFLFFFLISLGKLTPKKKLFLREKLFEKTKDVEKILALGTQDMFPSLFQTHKEAEEGLGTCKTKTKTKTNNKKERTPFFFFS